MLPDFKLALRECHFNLCSVVNKVRFCSFTHILRHMRGFCSRLIFDLVSGPCAKKQSTSREGRQVATADRRKGCKRAAREIENSYYDTKTDKRGC